MGPRARLNRLENHAHAAIDKYENGVTIEAELEVTEPLRAFILSAIASIVSGDGVQFPKKLPIKARLKVIP